MKCLPECGFNQTPNNSFILASHMNACDLDGPLKSVENPVVVWRDGGFEVAREAAKNENIFDVGFVRIQAPVEPEVIPYILTEEEAEEATVVLSEPVFLTPQGSPKKGTKL